MLLLRGHLDVDAHAAKVEGLEHLLGVGVDGDLVRVDGRLQTTKIQRKNEPPVAHYCNYHVSRFGTGWKQNQKKKGKEQPGAQADASDRGVGQPVQIAALGWEPMTNRHTWRQSVPSLG